MVPRIILIWAIQWMVVPCTNKEGAFVGKTGMWREQKRLGFFFLMRKCFVLFCCVGSSLLCAGFLQLWRAGAILRSGVWVSICSSFSCCRAGALGVWASVVAARGLSSCGSRALERSLSSCGAWAQLFCSMWDLPRPGLEPVSPALAGRFLTTVPPGKSPGLDFEF